MTRWLPLCWAVVLTVLLLGHALAPGYVLVRDMVWVPDLALRPDALGLGSALPRAVPSDAVVAALDELVPGMLLQKLVLVGSLLGAGTGAAALVGGAPVRRLVAVSVAIWNPFVAERLAIGHWPVLLGYAAVPWLAVAGRRVASGGRIPAWTLLVLVAGSLSASAGLVSAAVLLATGLTRVRRERSALLVLAVLAANAPWVAAGLAHASAAADAGGYRLFATSGDALPAPLAVLALGGIWNAEVVPASREGLLAWVSLAVTVALAGAGARRWWCSQGRRQGLAHASLWAIGIGVALMSWASPSTLATLGGHVPGLGILRDGSRTLGLALPLTVGLVATGAEVLVGRVGPVAARWSLAVAVVLVPVAVLTDAAWGVGGALAATALPQEWRDASRTVGSAPGEAVLLPWSAYRAPAWNDGRPVLDPLGRLLPVDVVADDDLVVGSTTIAGEDPRATQVRDVLATATPAGRAEALRALGVRWVVVEKDAGASPAVEGSVVHDGPLLRVVRLDGEVRARTVPAGTVIAQSLAWAAFVGLGLAGVGTIVRRVGVRMTTSSLPTGSVRD